VQLSGIFNILATPFDRDQRLDLESLRTLVEFQLDCGVDGLTILGVLGEAAKLSVDERRTVTATVIETVAGRVPVVVGTSHQDVATCIDLSKAAFEAGAAGVMIAPPRLDNPTDEEVIALYARVEQAVANTIVVQDLPSSNGVIMSPAMLAALAERVPSARHIKLEDPPLMQKISAIREATDAYTILGGAGGMFLLEELERGAAGTMTGFAFTEVLVSVYRQFAAGDQEGAARTFYQFVPLIRYENQPVINLTIRKEILARRGAIACATPRDPFAPIDAGTHEEIGRALARVGITDPRARLALPGTRHAVHA
jgi:4-hydroxy-tetrahydrodipicolinate synthase